MSSVLYVQASVEVTNVPLGVYAVAFGSSVDTGLSVKLRRLAIEPKLSSEI